MRYRPDGSIQTANVPTYQNVGGNEDNMLYRAMVTKVIYQNDPNNITRNAASPEVLYDCVIMGGGPSGNILSNCRLASFLGGNNTFFERTLQASTKDVTKVRLSDHDGDVVYILFVQGRNAYPIIIGLGNGIGVGPQIGATEQDGPRLRSQFNGVFEEINNLGEWCFVRKGGQLNAETGVFEPAAAPPYEAELKFLNDLMIWQDPNSSMSFFKTDIKWEHIVGKEETVYKETVDGKAEKTTRTYKSGLTVEEDGANDIMTITTKGGCKITVDGTNDTVEIKDNDTGKLKITGNTVALGASGIELLQQISDQLQSIATVFDTVKNHIHTAGNLGYPTSPPDTSFVSTWATGKSELDAIKAKVDSIKGTL